MGQALQGWIFNYYLCFTDEETRLRGALFAFESLNSQNSKMARSAHTLKIRFFSRPQSWWITTCIGTRSPPGFPVHRVCHHAWLFFPNTDCRVKLRSSHLPSKLFISWHIYPTSKFTFVGKAKSCSKWWTECKDHQIHSFHTLLWKICWVVYISTCR